MVPCAKNGGWVDVRMSLLDEGSGWVDVMVRSLCEYKTVETVVEAA